MGLINYSEVKHNNNAETQGIKVYCCKILTLYVKGGNVI